MWMEEWRFLSTPDKGSICSKATALLQASSALTGQTEVTTLDLKLRKQTSQKMCPQTEDIKGEHENLLQSLQASILAWSCSIQFSIAKDLDLIVSEYILTVSGSWKSTSPEILLDPF